MKTSMKIVIAFLAALFLSTSGVVYLLFSLPPVRVVGDSLVDRYSREIRLKGFRLWRNKIKHEVFNGKYTQEDFDRIRSWGFNVIEIDFYWGSELEPNQSAPGLYDSEWLDTLDPFIKMAKKAGLYFILSSRVSTAEGKYEKEREAWGGWGRDSYVCTPEGLERYAKCIEWLAGEVERRGWDNVIAYEPHQFPFHQYPDPSAEEVEFYYNTVRPRLVNAVRKHSNRIIIMPSRQCRARHFSDKNMTRLQDNNVVYSFTFYPYEGMTHGKGQITQWDYDEQWQREYLEPVIAWKKINKAPLFVTEWGVRGDTRPQVDVTRFKAQLLEEIGASWLYHTFENFQSDNFSILYPDNSPKGILIPLVEYNRIRYGLKFLVIN